MNKRRQILIRPLYTEKISRYQDHENKYAFEVARNANKIEIKKEIESKFEVKVLSVNTMIVRGKIHQQLTRAGRFTGRRPDWKKAVVQLAEGDKLELFENA
jgi:large subunit ribosomal protein L23